MWSGRSSPLLTATVNRFPNSAWKRHFRVLACLPMWQRGRATALFSSMHSVKPTDATQVQAPEREQKMAAQSYVSEAWAKARLDGIDDDCMARSCLLAAFAELCATYRWAPAATSPGNLPR